MSKGKIVLAATAATLCAVGITTATIFVCKRLFEKNYFTVSSGLNN